MVIAAIILATLSAIFWAIYTIREVPVLVATSDLPALHTITPTDVRLGTIRTQNADEYAGLPVDGRLTLTRIKSGTPLKVTDLTPPSMVGALNGSYVITGIDVSRADVLGEALSAGDSIQLLISQQRAPVGQLNAIVVSVSRGGEQPGSYSLVVAIGSEDARIYGSALGTGDVVVIRDPRQR